MVCDGPVEELIRVLPVIVGWQRPHAVVAIAIILLTSGPGYGLRLLVSLEANCEPFSGYFTCCFWCLPLVRRG